jgi:hypothetical protein
MTGMHFRGLPKAKRSAFRKLAALAYERELGAELTQLEAAFAAWRSGQCDAFDLEKLIHQFHQGPARALYVRYADGDPIHAVAAAIVAGIMAESEVPEPIRPELEPAITLVQDLSRKREEDE